MEAPTYRVDLDIFAGPLDLLLYLVRRNEVDVVELPLARITEQFKLFLDVLSFIDIELAGDFILMASTLAEIKSRLVLPRPPEETEDEAPPETDDPRSELIARLLEYRKFKEAATALEDRAAQWQERYPRLSDDRPTVDKDPAADRIKEVELWDLVSALGRVLRHQHIEEETSIKYDDTPVAVYVDQVGERVRREGMVKFTSLFEGECLRSRIVGLFLAILELLRHHHFLAEQPEDYGEIFIRPPTEEELQPFRSSGQPA
ncbi:MAG: segregation and condensation protein A [Planctomycetaceae bacterium]